MRIVPCGRHYHKDPALGRANPEDVFLLEQSGKYVDGDFASRRKPSEHLFAQQKERSTLWATMEALGGTQAVEDAALGYDNAFPPLQSKAAPVPVKSHHINVKLKEESPTSCTMLKRR
jgi:hypothetical protein